jgi:competence protein ComEA
MTIVSKLTLVLLLVVILLGACRADLQMAATSSNSKNEIAEDAININTASAAELQSIPFIGEKLAQRIVEFREANGPFRRPEHLMLVQGISDMRFRQIRRLVRVE